MKKLERKFIIMLIADELYAMPLLKDGKFIDYNQLNILPVPNTNNKIIGLIYLEGKIVTVLDTAKILNLSKNKNNLLFIFDYNDDIYGLTIQGSGEIIKVDKILVDNKRKKFKKYIKQKNKKMYILNTEDIFNEIKK